MSHEHPRVRVSPISPVTDLPRALDHYAALGRQIDPNGNLLRFGSPLRSPG